MPSSAAPGARWMTGSDGEPKAATTTRPGTHSPLNCTTALKPDGHFCTYRNSAPPGHDVPVATGGGGSHQPSSVKAVSVAREKKCMRAVRTTLRATTRLLS